MVIRRIGPGSLAKIAGAIYVALGLVLGAFFSLGLTLVRSFGPTIAKPVGFGRLFGTSAVVILPILYGVVGYVTALISGLAYNFLAGLVGGIEVDIE